MICELYLHTCVCVIDLRIECAHRYTCNDFWSVYIDMMMRVTAYELFVHLCMFNDLKTVYRVKQHLLYSFLPSIIQNEGHKKILKYNKLSQSMLNTMQTAYIVRFTVKICSGPSYTCKVIFEL